MHFPLQMHRFALPAARAAECAGRQGRIEAIHRKFFEEQDALGLKSWSEYATAAGVFDLGAFGLCMNETGPIAKVEAGKALGASLDIKGTPTVIINGWVLQRPPALEDLDKMVKTILIGKEPVSTTK